MKIVIAVIVALFVGIPIVTVGMPALMAERPEAPKVERVKPAPASVVTAAKPQAFSVEERARWACSHAVEARSGLAPGSIKWLRRSQWVTVERAPGGWEVVAMYTPDGRAWLSATCALRVRADGEVVVSEVRA